MLPAGVAGPLPSCRIASFNSNRSWGVFEDFFANETTPLNGGVTTLYLVQEPPNRIGNTFRDLIVIKAECNADALPGAREWSRAVILAPRAACILSTITKPDVVSVDVGLCDQDGVLEPLRLISFYADKLQDSNIVCRHLAELSGGNCVTVVGGDTNSHSYLWSARSLPTNDIRVARGRPFEEFILQEGFEVFKPPVPTYTSSLGASYIDLLACKRAPDCCFGFAPTCGDHVCLRVTLPCSNRKLASKPASSPKRYPSRTNWETFSETLSRAPIKLGLASTTAELDEMASAISDRLTNAIKRSTPLATRRDQSAGLKKPVWWNKNLDGLRREYNRARKLVRSTNRHRSTGADSTDGREAVRRTKRAYFNGIKQAKLDRLGRELSSMDETGVHRRFKTRTPATATYDKAEILDHFFGLRQQPPALGHGRFNHLSGDYSGNLAALGGPLTDEEVETAGRSLKTRKSCGHDGIFYEHVRYACQKVPWFRDAIGDVFNSILRLTYYPTIYKRSDLCLLFKANGPVALGSCLGKYFELLLKRRLLSALGIPPECVHGYVPHRSTVTAVQSIIDHQQQQDREARAITVTFDVASAFDKIAHSYIVTEITAITGIPQWGALIESYLHGGDVHLDGLKTYRAAGIPQGGIISPVCFCASTWRVGKRIGELRGPFSIRVAIYADDFCIRIVALGLLGLSEGVRQAVDTLSAWTEDADLSIDRQKTEALTDCSLTAELLKDELEGQDTQFVSDSIKGNIKWLGFWLTPSLSWSTHVDYAFGKALRALAIIRRLSGRSWGVSPGVALCAWRTHVVPILLYGIELWGGVASYEWFRKRCSRLEAVFFRSVCGLCRSTPTLFASRCFAMITEPLWLQARVRYADYHLHRSQGALSTRIRATLSKWGIEDCSGREVPRIVDDPHKAQPLHGWHCEMTSGMPPRPNNSAHYFYSDGSVVDRGNVVAKTGTGVVRLVSGHQSGHEGRCYNTGPHANILQCEAVGLWAAMSWALELRMQGDPRKTAYLCCDSQAAIRSVANVLRDSDRASTELTREVAGLIRRWIGQGTDGYQAYL
ncbi:hypothetical protein FOL46_000885, partial [Perkinsus olseni]